MDTESAISGLHPSQGRAYEETPVKYKGIIKKAYLEKLSPRQAIKAKCVECCGFEDAVHRVRFCEVYRCPLWAYRPYQKGNKNESTV